MPSRLRTLAGGLSRVCDAGGLVLLMVLGWRMFFDFDSALEATALLVGLIGTIGCWTRKEALRNAPWSMLAYVALALLSSAVHQWEAASGVDQPAWMALFRPAFHLIVMAVFIYGAAHLLRTPTRLSWFVVTLVACIAVLAAQMTFDRAAEGFTFVRGGRSFASVPQWSGIGGTSLLLTIAVPMVAAPMVDRRTIARVMAGGVLVSGLLVATYLNSLRGGLVTTIVGLAGMAAFALLSRMQITRRPRLLGFVFVGLAAGLLAVVWALRTFVASGADFSGRTLIWKATFKLMIDHPWLGVGPGNYSQAITASGHAEEFLLRYGGLHNAHNLVLHSGAEIGIAGALCLVVFLAWALTACWRAWAHGQLPVVSLGLLFACGGFMFHSLSENFFDARIEVERTRLVVWMILAAALALERLSRAAAPHPA